MPRKRPPPLARSFYDCDTVELARSLLGLRLVREIDGVRLSGWIVEVEAYLGADDPASHSYRGPRPRNRSMFGPPGHAYVYAIHSRWCFNVVSRPAGVPEAVLVRAIEPDEGIAAMASRRGAVRPLDLTRGPARLCEALGVDRALDGHDLTRGRQLWLTAENAQDIAPATIGVSPRIGVTSAHDWPLRFFVAGSRHVSGRRGVAGETRGADRQRLR